ncbi:unnamed protein product [Sphagnum jensenii]|uniref:NADH:quinone oxidoreductase/Mrp antiporter transmembrane domain-containing protein n=1 Tax=Sphagnum jensenii TaxID=128206 RepID=A0ABP1A3W6_9BRYO
MKLELDLSFLYGSTILPKRIFIICMIIILILDLISDERDTSSLYFISLATLVCLSLCSYLLSKYTKKDVQSNEIVMKYLLMGGISSFSLAYGLSWLYGLFGEETQFQEVINSFINIKMYNSSGAFIGLICIIVGIGFKLSLIPFHQWTPNVYKIM